MHQGFKTSYLQKEIQYNWATSYIIIFIAAARWIQFGNNIRFNHIEWQKQKIKVKCADQTRSASVADSSEFSEHDLKDSNSKVAHRLLNLYVTWTNFFDFFNSRHKFAKGFKTAISQ